MTTRPSRRQLRRHARQLRRDGFQPMMLLNSGDQLPETAAAAIGRALWRYRSELAPIAFAALTVLAAMPLHRAHPGSWPWLAVATVASMTVLVIPAPAWLRKAWFVLGRPAERVYAAAVAAVTGGWLTAATALGPATPPMPALAAGLTLICALPWWASRRRRAKVRVERMLESWPEIARAVGLAGSQVMSAMVDLCGWQPASAWRAARPFTT
jgi:S-DNA-T family DNA segregation ATPase FtsK/SpoIIIE